MPLFRRSGEPDIAENEERQQSLLISQLSEQNQTLRQMVVQTQNEYRELETAVREFCKMLVYNRLAQSQMAGSLPNMGVLDFIQWTKTQFAQGQMEDQSKVMTLLQTAERLKQQVQAQQEQIMHMQMRERDREQAGAPLPSSAPLEQTANKTPVGPAQRPEEAKPVQPVLPVMPVPVASPSIGPVILPTEELLPPPVTPVPTMEQKRLGNTTSQPAKASGKSQLQSSPRDQKRDNKGPRKNVIQGVVIADPAVVVMPGQPMSPKASVDQTSTADEIGRKNVAQGASIKQRLSESAPSDALDVSPLTKLDNLPVVPSEVPQLSAGEGEAGVHVMDLRKLLSRINDQDWIILLGIAEKGLSLSKDLTDIARGEGMNDAAFNRSMSRIRDMGLVDGEKVNIGVKWFWAYALTDLGHRVYVKKTGKKAVICEREKMVRDHTTAAHGYGIRETAEIMGEMDGVQSITIDRITNRIELPNRREIIPDVIVTFESGDKLYMEYELGHHHQTDFNLKCDRLAELSPDIVFVTPDQERFVQVKNQLEKWLEKRMKEVGEHIQSYSIHLTTLTKLKSGVWEYEWPPAPEGAD